MSIYGNMGKTTRLQYKLRRIIWRTKTKITNQELNEIQKEDLPDWVLKR